MPYPLTPKLKVPFRIVGARALVVTQGSVDEIAQCVEYLLRTEPGTRLEMPEFGCTDLAFTQSPAKDPAPSIIQAAIDRWEPRARYTLAAEEIEVLTKRVRLRLGGAE